MQKGCRKLWALEAVCLKEVVEAELRLCARPEGLVAGDLIPAPRGEFGEFIPARHGGFLHEPSTGGNSRVEAPRMTRLRPLRCCGQAARRILPHQLDRPRRHHGIRHVQRVTAWRLPAGRRTLSEKWRRSPETPPRGKRGLRPALFAAHVGRGRHHPRFSLF